jgi:hypothetical protein
MKIFYLNPATEQIELHKEEIRLIKEFNKLLSRDKGIKDKEANETDRLIKKKALQEFTFLYFYCDWDSPYVSYSDEERYEKAKKDAGLPNSWFIDGPVAEAVTYYTEEQLKASPDIAIIMELKKSLQTTNLFIKQLRSMISNDMKVITDAQQRYDDIIRSSEDPIAVESAQQNLVVLRAGRIEAITTNLNQLIKFSVDVPKSIKQLNQYEAAAKEDIGDTSRVVVGGGEVYARESTDYLKRLERLNINTTHVN